MSRLILSLTAIPPRFAALPRVLGALLAQTARVEALHLYLPRRYRRFEWDPADLPAVPDGVTIRLIDTDMGPATKVLPAVAEFRGQDVQILFCDDDKSYDAGWAQRFVDAAAAHPGCAIAEEGGEIAHNSTHDWHGTDLPRHERVSKDAAYRLRRALSLGRWKPRKVRRSGYADILEGWGGALVRPEFFGDGAFDIPPALWMIDDIWLSGQLALSGVPVWLNADQPLRTRGVAGNAPDAALVRQVVDGQDRRALNQAGVDHFRDKYGIWGGTTP